MKHLVLFFALSLLIKASAQTSGAGYISSIESKANTIENLQNKIAQLETDLKRWRLERNAQDDLLQKKLAAKLTEIETSQSWINRRESAKNGWKENYPGTCGAGGPPPICVANHWHRVSISDAMREYEDFKKKELDKIHDEIDRAKKDYDDKIDKAEREVPKIYDEIDRLKREIVQMSKDYKDVVVKAAKNVQSIYLAELMRIVAEKHFIEDRINIITVKIADLNTEESKALNESAEKVRKQNEEEKQKIAGQIEVNKQKLEQLLQAHLSRLSPLKLNNETLKQKLFDLNKQLQNVATLAASEIKMLQDSKTDTEDKIAQLQKTIEEYESQYTTSKQQTEQEIKTLADKSWDLTVNLSKRQQETAEILKKAFALRRKILTDAKVARQANLQLTGELLLSKKASLRKKFMDYAADADKERVRLIRACQKATCSCYGIDTYGDIIGNWNKAEGCVAEMEAAHFSTDPIYGCVDETANYRQHYSSLINGLSDSDIQALQKQSGKIRYDLILKKISN